jgi:hypothetical protein
MRLLGMGVHPKVAKASGWIDSQNQARLAPVQPWEAGMQEDASERVDVAPQAAINRRTKDIGFDSKARSAKPAAEN